MRIFFCCCCLVLQSVVGISQTALPVSTEDTDTLLYQIDSFRHTLPLINYTQILFDPEDEYQLSDLMGGDLDGAFEPLSNYKSHNFKASQRPWVKIQIQNNLSNHEVWSFDFNFMADSILAFVLRENQEIDSFKLGRFVHPEETRNGSKFLQKVFNPRYPIVLNIPVGEKIELYAKFHPTFLVDMRIRPALRSLEETMNYHASLSKDYVIVFFYAGLLLMLVLYNFLIYVFYKEKPYLYLALYVFCFTMPSNFYIGTWFVKQWFPDLPFLIYLRVVFLVPLLYIFVSLFIRSYLKTKTTFPRTDIYLRILMILGMGYFVFSTLLYFWVGTFTLPIRLEVDIGMSLSAGILLFLTFLDIYKSKQSSVWFLLASLMVVLGSQIISILGRYSIFIYEISTKVVYPLEMIDIGILAQIIILTLGVGYESRKVAREKELLEERDQIKSQFFANISHEFRTPLTLILGPIRQQLSKTQNPEDRQLLEIAEHNAERQLKLVNDLLSLSKIEAGKSELSVQQVQLKPLLKGVLYAYESLAVQKEIQLQFATTEEEIDLYLDPEKFKVILYNLLSNAFKYVKSGDSIGIELSKKGKWIELIVRDTGAGIDPNNLPHIFDRFFQTNFNEHEATGIGLALVKELIKLHQADIRVESKLGKGTSFHMKFLLGKAHFPKAAFTSNETAVSSTPGKPFIATTPKVPPISKPEKDSILPRVLLIEDNPDVRYFIRQGLESDFEIMEAENGEVGLQKAFEEMPDLIISDVMMPVMDGYQVCKSLKTDIRTSHIPIILLTAKAAQEEKLEGLETGADDYLIKPFDTQELSVRVQNLIQLRQELRHRFATALYLKPSEIRTNSLDKDFLERALNVVEVNMANEDLTIDFLANELQVSRATLNRKLRALLDQSANDFIKSVRLQRAADLLKQEAGSVAEIAFLTGFSSTAYFVKTFGDYFGTTPGNYRKDPS